MITAVPPYRPTAYLPSPTGALIHTPERSWS
jgi:hypothetical protein